MKKGSTDDPFAEEPTINSEESERTEENNDGGNSTSDNTTLQSIKSGSREKTDDDTLRILPYIHKRDAVKEGRTQRPVYLREYNEERIPELVTEVEGHLGEEITKTDLLEAAMETAVENPQLVADILRTERYGYDWE